MHKVSTFLHKAWIALLVCLACFFLIQEFIQKRYLDTKAIKKARQDILSLARQGQTDEALHELSKLEEIIPENTSLSSDRMKILHLAGRTGEADLVAQKKNNWQETSDEYHAPISENKTLVPNLERHTEKPVTDTNFATLNTNSFPELHTASLATTPFANPVADIHARTDALLLQAGDGNLESAIAAFRKDTAVQWPAYGYRNLIRASRNRKQYATARWLSKQGLKHHPKDAELHAMRLLILADQDKTLDQALNEYNQLPDSLKNQSPIIGARAWIAEQQKQPALAASLYSRQQLNNNPGYATKASVAQFLEANAPEQALQLIEEHPNLFKPDTKAQAMEQQASRTLSIALHTMRKDPDSRWITKADQQLYSLCEFSQKNNLAYFLNRCIADRISLYQARSMDQEALNLYQETEHQTDLPFWAHEAITLSALKLENMALAEKAAGNIQKDSPVKGNLLTATQQHQQTERYYHNRKNSLPNWYWGKDGKQKRPNYAKLELENKRIASIAYDNRLNEAISEQRKLVSSAPGHNASRLQLSTFYRWNGWKLRAQRERSRAVSTDPYDALSLGHNVRADLEDGQFSQANDTLEVFHKTHPGDNALPDLDALHATLTGPYLYASSKQTTSSGNTSSISNKDQLHRLSLYSAAWESLNDTRAFVSVEKIHSEYVSSSGEIQRNGIGLSTRQFLWGARLSFTRRDGGSKEQGGRFHTYYQFNDHFEWSMHLQKDSAGTPIRASENGIQSNSLDTRIHYTPDRLSNYSLNLGFQDYSDNNRQQNITLSGNQTVWTNHDQKIQLSESVSHSRSRTGLTPYFSPESSSNLMLHLSYSADILVRFQKHWRHTIRIGAGTLNQKNYSTGTIGDAAWEHQIKINKRVSIGTGIQWASHLYDGNRESQKTLYGNLLWRWN